MELYPHRGFLYPLNPNPEVGLIPKEGKMIISTLAYLIMIGVGFTLYSIAQGSSLQVSIGSALGITLMLTPFFFALISIVNDAEKIRDFLEKEGKKK